MAKQRILVVDDDQTIVALIGRYLEKDGYQTLSAGDGLAALELIRRKQPDLVVLDLMLPGMDGLDICRILRQESNSVPIIMLTAKTTEVDKLVGLELGADDYVTKPFSPKELLARIRAVLRRTKDAASSRATEVRLGDLMLDFVRHEVRAKGEVLQMTPTEFKLLETMANSPGRAFSRMELLDSVFGLDYEGLERTVDVHVMNLRHKIEPDPANPTYIQTVYGLGYRLCGDNHAA
jgi:DNA-binding response OmpR family regulator